MEKEGKQPVKTWSELVSDSRSDLSFIEIPEAAVVNDVLRIPKEVIDKGCEKLQCAVVAQFVGPQPPLRVFNAVARRLWGYEGPVLISLLSENFFLVEFNSIQLCEWVLDRSWHIHNSGLILRRWHRGIQPVRFTPANTPEWVMFKNVPPELITVDGISWVSSKVGKPLNKYVRDGVSIRVCLLREKSIPCPEMVRVELDDGIIESIEVQRFQAREYKKPEVIKEPAEKVWVVKGKGQEVATTSGASGAVVMQDIPDPIVVAGVVTRCDTPDPVETVKVASAAGTGTSKTKKRRKNRKKNLDKVLQAASVSQPIIMPVNDVQSGNGSASPLGGTEAPALDVVVQGVGGGPGNGSKASLQVEEPPGQLRQLSSPKIAEVEGEPYNCSESGEGSSTEEEAVQEVVKLKQRVVSGVKTRNKRR
ncbi:hypothetical protein LINPERPRIM_LOCUS201 [Linum perenne]